MKSYDEKCSRVIYNLQYKLLPLAQPSWEYSYARHRLRSSKVFEERKVMRTAHRVINANETRDRHCGASCVPTSHSHVMLAPSSAKQLTASPLCNFPSRWHAEHVEAKR